jgi:hypothetical protein
MTFAVWLMLSTTAYATRYVDELALLSNNSITETQLSQYFDAVQLMGKIKRLEANLVLKYKNDKDLFETCKLICKYENSTFNRYHIAAIIAKESKFDSRAWNKRDGGKGLTMTMPKYWKKELPWYTNPWDKEQSIKACVQVLSILHTEQQRRTWEAIRKYNGSAPSTHQYVADAKRIYGQLVIL